MSSLPTQQPRPSETTLTEAVLSGAAIALGLLTALLITGQWQGASASVSNVLTQVGRWLGAAPAAVTFARDWVVVVTETGEVLLYDRQGRLKDRVQP